MTIRLVAALAAALTLSGCVAPLAAGLATGAGIVGVEAANRKLTNDAVKRELSRDDRLTFLTAAHLSIPSNEVHLISNKEWEGEILHWTAATSKGVVTCEQIDGAAQCFGFDE